MLLEFQLPGLLRMQLAMLVSSLLLQFLCVNVHVRARTRMIRRTRSPTERLEPLAQARRPPRRFLLAARGVVAAARRVEGRSARAVQSGTGSPRLPWRAARRDEPLAMEERSVGRGGVARRRAAERAKWTG